MRTLQASLVVAVWLLGIGANLVSPNASQAAPAPPDAIHPLDAIHEVMPGDDLHLIAGYYYGDARQWERIWRANRDQIANPNRLERGILLRIPDAVLPEESYADFVARARGGTGPAAVPVKSEVPAQPEVEAKPEVEVRIAGEEPAPATPVSPEREPATPAGPPAAAQPASPGTPGPSNVVGAPGTLPPRPILPGPASRP
jgi:hypothetical protein